MLNEVLDVDVPVGESADPAGDHSDARDPLEHKVKSWPQFFEANASGAKTFDLRRSTDRDYRVGDYLRMQEFEPKTARYTGRELLVRITYVTSAAFPCALSDNGLNPGFCILGFHLVPTGGE